MMKSKPQTITGAVCLSPEWKAWEKYAYDGGWDWAESNDTSWMSDEHFAAFMDFVRTTKRRYQTKKVQTIEIEIEGEKA
jgi:hypothetical protein